MSRVSLNYDDGSRIDFNDAGDALYHLQVQGVAGVVELRDDDGEAVSERNELEDQLAVLAEHKVEAQHVPRADFNEILGA